jgi:hypothetical protein
MVNVHQRNLSVVLQIPYQSKEMSKETGKGKGIDPKTKDPHAI